MSKDYSYSDFFGQLVSVNDGSLLGHLLDNGYLILRKDGKTLYCHRLIYELHHGPIPEGMEIDHINGQRDCNYIWNLRLATPSQNQCNTCIRSDNKSGVKGVFWSESRGSWIASVTYKGKLHRRLFPNVNIAIDWVEQKRRELHKEFSNHGFHYAQK